MDNNKIILSIGIAAVLIVILFVVAITLSSLRLPPTEFQQKLFFASGVLIGLALLFVFSIAVYVWGPPPAANGTEPPGKVVFDACVKVIPPIITLILGYYFGVATSSTASTNQSNQPVGVEQSNLKQRWINPMLYWEHWKRLAIDASGHRF